MSLSLYSLVRSTFVSVVTWLSTSETKPWSLMLFSMFFLYVSLVIVELMLNIGLVIIHEGVKSLGTKTLGTVQCFVTCDDLPDLVLLRCFFSFLDKFIGILWLWHFNTSFHPPRPNNSLCSCILKWTTFYSIPLSIQVNLS